ncbi:DNA replication/repair protein RecF [Aliiglaciecola sp. CAU 1673]|uniref:DNA replication/repair protein RecF n=1 Tax=Aliiglaciecola sp. CAU 1673 TaxID=3032595 RepID=UPI0023DCB2CB|nr:DNA replication/repair protein RecF [Aliiglaciecola sp. CAU 1673]MDF2179733.1 DNA replication/repair protein RecF [Aliiglaciecola sp. CAU 1673]
MRLDKIQISNFRNLAEVAISPARQLNVILGANGSGKSSILEAIHYLGFGRSFRTNRHQHVIQHQTDSFTVFCRAQLESGATTSLGYQRHRNGDILIRQDGESIKRVSDLVKLLPCQIFTPSSVEVIEGAPGLRRRFLDWGLFHVEQSYWPVSVKYQQLLKHRNALLRQSAEQRRTMIDDYWQASLANEGEVLSSLRKSFLNAIEPYIMANLSHFLPEFCLEISYHSGWEKGRSLADVLQENVHKDIRYGYTTSGPHKFDIRIKVDGLPAQDVLSRGQGRMLMAALLLAQAQYLQDQKQRGCVFLLDDIGAELDASKRQLFVEKLLETSAQIFITAIEEQQVAFIRNHEQMKLFHVEHGQVKEE